MLESTKSRDEPAAMPRIRNCASLEMASFPSGLLNPFVASSVSSSTFVAYPIMSERLVAPMSERNSGVNGEMEAGVSFRRVLSRLPLVVLAAW